MHTKIFEIVAYILGRNLRFNHLKKKTRGYFQTRCTQVGKYNMFKPTKQNSSTNNVLTENMSVSSVLNLNSWTSYIVRIAASCRLLLPFHIFLKHFKYHIFK